MRRKHKKFIDPRYFMEEKLEEIRPPFKGGYQHEEPDNSEVKPTPGGYQKEEDDEDKAQTEAARQILSHLSQIQEILESDAARFLGAGGAKERAVIENLSAAHDHFKDMVQYLEKY